jgi:hypothetical protein
MRLTATATRFGLVTLLFAAGFQGGARANYVTNLTFSTGSTLPFNLSVDAGATNSISAWVQGATLGVSR